MAAAAADVERELVLLLSNLIITISQKSIEKAALEPGYSLLQIYIVKLHTTEPISEDRVITFM